MPKLKFIASNGRRYRSKPRVTSHHEVVVQVRDGGAWQHYARIHPVDASSEAFEGAVEAILARCHLDADVCLEISDHY